MHYAGIDWGMEKHDICIQTADGRVISHTSVKHDWTGFQALQELLQGLDDLKIVLERSDGLLVDWLVGNGWQVHMIHPTFLAHRRPRRSKDDRGDAKLLADLLRVGDADCRPIPKQSPLIHQIKQAAIAYEQARADQRRWANRLMYILRQYYPAAIHAFPTIYSLTCLAFLEAFPTPAAAKALSITELGAFLAQQRYTARTALLPRMYAAFQEPMPAALVPEAYVVRLKAVVPMLRAAWHQRTYAEKALVTLFQQHPEADWWSGFPGSGPLTAARLLAYVGDARERFPSPEVLQAVAGTVPVTRRSGKQLQVEFRTACSHPLRAAVIDLARNSLRASGWARSYFDEQRARGHDVTRASRALANRWLSIIWKLWQTNEPYSEARHVANRSRHKRPLHP